MTNIRSSGATSLLVVSAPADLHAHAMTWAMQAYGVETLRWCPAPPWTQGGSVRFDPAGSIGYGFEAHAGEVTPTSVGAVWLRRWPQPAFPASFREGDRLAARNELAAFYRGALALLPGDILWANPIAARETANLKLRQLAAARTTGLRIPDTLITDDAGRAKSFVESLPDGEVIYKPFFTFHWQTGAKVRHTVTTRVTAADFDDPEQLVWSPGIFQRYVPKACELRVNVFGRTCLSVRIFDQDPLDWRTCQSDMKVEPYDLPQRIERKVHKLMDELGLAMGMIDLIVTPDGEYVFLEVNEQGQFLWVEEMCPDVPLLDLCARFFASGDRHFRDETATAKIGLGDFMKSSALEELETADREFRAAGGIHNMLLIKE